MILEKVYMLIDCSVLPCQKPIFVDKVREYIMFIWVSCFLLPTLYMSHIDISVYAPFAYVFLFVVNERWKVYHVCAYGGSKAGEIWTLSTIKAPF